MAGAEQGRDASAADEAVRARDQDGGHGWILGDVRGIVASTDDDPPTSTATASRLVEAMPKAELHLHLDGSLRVATALELARTRGRRRAARLGRDVARAHRADALRRPGPAPRGVRPADRAHAGRRGARADHRGAGRDQGRRRRPLRRDPLGAAAPRHGRRAARRRDRRRLRAAPPRAAARTGVGRPAHLHGAALARPRREPRPRRDGGPVPRPGPDRLGPRRPGGAPTRIRGQHAARLRRRAGRRPADHPPCRRMGRRGAGAPRARDGPGAHRPRSRHASTTRRSAPS